MLHGSTAQVTLKPKCGSITIFEENDLCPIVYIMQNAMWDSVPSTATAYLSGSRVVTTKLRG